MQRHASTPEEYRNDVEGTQREMLESIRDAIFEVVPTIKEIIEYGMLGYPGLANLAAQKRHVALYVKPSVLAEHKDGFPEADCSKSCLRFKRPEQIDQTRLRALLKDVLVARGGG